MSQRIKDLPAAERPRERLAERGADALTHAELIAILLRTGLQGKSAIVIAQELLNRHGSLDALSRATLDDLRTVPGVGRDKAVTLKAAFTLARRMVDERAAETPLMDTPDRIAGVMREEFREENVERFFAVLLNTRRRLIRRVPLAHGTLDSLLVHPRDVFKSAIAANAAAVVLVHNHPSGDPSPSEADIKVTRDLIRAGQLLKIDVLDHVIIGRATEQRPHGYASLRELGYFYA
ncbi:MAG: DNA repair protein RadC [Verrucomicrobia bacterium]|nr:DNA repair protein RadC [Verrucomicrobiota bacterium]